MKAAVPSLSATFPVPEIFGTQVSVLSATTPTAVFKVGFAIFFTVASPQTNELAKSICEKKDFRQASLTLMSKPSDDEQVTSKSSLSFPHVISRSSFVSERKNDFRLCDQQIEF